MEAITIGGLLVIGFALYEIAREEKARLRKTARNVRRRLP